jgi:hypothetical protein
LAAAGFVSGAHGFEMADPASVKAKVTNNGAANARPNAAVTKALPL